MHVEEHRLGWLSEYARRRSAKGLRRTLTVRSYPDRVLELARNGHLGAVTALSGPDLLARHSSSRPPATPVSTGRLRLATPASLGAPEFVQIGEPFGQVLGDQRAGVVDTVPIS